MKAIRRILVALAPLRWVIGGMFILSTLTAVINSGTPWIYREVINFLTTSQTSRFFGNFIPDHLSLMGKLVALVGLYFAVLLTDDIINAALRYMDRFTRPRVWTMLRMESLRRIQALSMSFFTQNPPGAVSETLSAGASEAYPIIRGITVDLWPTAINFLVAIISIAFLNLWMAGGLTIMIIAYAALAVWRTRINRKREERIRPYTEKQTRNWITALTYQDLIKQFSRQEDTEAELAILYKEIVEINRQRAVAMTWIWMGQEFLWKLAVVMVYGYGGYLVLVTKTLKIGDLILFVAFMDRAMGPLSYILDIYDNMQVGLVSVERMFKIWDKPIEVKDEPNAGKLIIDKATVRFKNVNFYYRDKRGRKLKQAVFKNFNLEIKPGETVALVGPSGAGKSTIIKLLLRFYDPDSGEISIDGQNIRTVTQASLRRQVSTIMQDVVVFNDTIKANLRYAKKSAKDSDLTRVLKMANLHDFVKRLSHQMNTLLGERGIHLSGGEKQRLGIARALLKDAPIIVMDEATSALDSENEHQIQQAMWELIEGKTTVIIAHRLSTVKRADRIVVLDHGRIVEQGTHKQLLAKKGYYKRLYTMQGALLREGQSSEATD